MSDTLVAQALVIGTNGLYLITSGDGSGTLAGTGLAFSIGPIDAPGTYPIGVDGLSLTGGGATITATGGQQWVTPLTGTAGTITITTLSATRIAGTFSYTAAPFGGGAVGNRVVTAGDFNVPISNNNGTIPTAPDSLGGTFSASFNGTPWVAAISSASRNDNPNGLFVLSGLELNENFTAVFPTPAGTGTYPLDNVPGHILMVQAGVGANAVCCWGVNGDTGSITFTSLTLTRAAGTFHATLSPQPATAAVGTLTITNGTFDVGLFHTP